MPLRLSLGLALFVGSLAAGWWLRRIGRLSEVRSSDLVRFLVKWLSPVSLCSIFWGMNLRSFEPWLLPFLGALLAAATVPPSLYFARKAGLTRPQTGSFLTCAFFSNLGYMGAFAAYAMYGEVAYGLCMLYMVFFTPCFYTWGFWTSARYGTPVGPTAMAGAFGDELRLYPFLSMAVGAILSLAGVPRPGMFEAVNQLLIPVSTALYLIAIGSQIRFESPKPHLRSCAVMCAVKFVYSPLLAWAVLSLLGIHGMARQIVMLLSITPVGVSPLVLPLLFGLDRPLANALWLVTTVVSVPLFLFIVPWVA